MFLIIDALREEAAPETHFEAWGRPLDH